MQNASFFHCIEKEKLKVTEDEPGVHHLLEPSRTFQMCCFDM